MKKLSSLKQSTYSIFNQKGNVAVIIIGIIICAIAAVVFWVFYTYRQTSTPTTKLIKIKTTLAKATPSEPEMLIIKKYELDKKNGLDLEYVDSNPGDAEREFFAGTFPIILNGTLSSFSINLKNIPIRIAAPAINQPYHIVVAKDSSIKTLQDLKGKKFATLPKITASYGASSTVLNSAGIDPEKDLKMVFVTPTQVVELLQKGEVDAGIVVSPLVYSMLSSGKFRSIADLEQVWESKEDNLPQPFVVVATNEDWYNKSAENQEALRRYVKTFNDAASLIQKDPQVLGQLTDYLKEYQLDTPEAIKMFEESYPKLLHSSYSMRGIEGLKRYYDRAKQYGVLPDNSPSVDLVIMKPSQLGF